MTLTLFLSNVAAPGAESPLELDPIDRYILAWKQSGGMESASRHHIHDFLTLLGVPTPDSPRPDLHENTYTYEMTHRFVDESGKMSIGNSDLCYEGACPYRNETGA